MDTLPSTFLHLFQDRVMLETISGSSYTSVIGEKEALGRKMTFGPFSVEYYTCDKEPILAPFRGLRFVIWNRVLRNTIPPKWILVSFANNHTISAMIDMRNADTYHTQWNGTHKTYYNHFYTQNEYYISEVSHEEYSLHYKKYADPIVNIVKNLAYLETLARLDKKNLHCYLLKNKEDDVFSGFAGADFFSASQSYYFSAFTRKDVAPKESGVWLINYWMKESSKKGIQFANLGPIWTEGQPKNWKGFTAFKMKFKPILLTLPKELIRFTFSI